MINIKKIGALLLTGILSCSFIACNDSNNDSSDGENGGEPPVMTTDFYLVENGKSEYKLLVSENPTHEELLCVSEINTFLAEATGITLPIVYETTEISDEEKFISIGKTDKLEESEITVNYTELGSSGYIVKTVDDDVYITGNQYGVVYAAYDFLEKEFNYHYYSDNVYKISKGVKNKKLVDFNVKEIPAFDYRVPSYGFQTKANKDSMCAYRMRLNDMESIAVGSDTGKWHSFFFTIPKEQYEADHENWYSLDGTQLCLTRDKVGLATEFKNKIVDMLEKNPTIKFVHIGQEDTRTWCECEECKEVVNRYGGYESSTYILFMNEVSDLLQPYLNENGLDVKLTMFAYHRTQSAPVAWDTQSGTYKVISDDLKLRKNVCVLYAPIEADYYEPFTGESNANTYKDFVGWSVIAEQMWLWTYTEHFTNYMFPLDNFNSMQKNFQLAEELGVVWYFNQSQWDNNNASGFSHLKAYLSAQLQWNPDLDIRKLTKDFCENYYGEASNIMLGILDDYKSWSAYVYYELGLKGALTSNPDDVQYWPYGMVKNWLDSIDEAYTLIEKYQDVDEQKYKRLYDAIALDSLSFRYITITYHADYYTESELLELKKAFKSDALKLNLSLWREHQTLGDINTLYQTWGIS